MFQIMFFLLQVFRELDCYGLAQVINMHIFLTERKFTPPVAVQSCNIAESSSSSRMSRERAVSLLYTVQNLLEQSNKGLDTGASNEPNQGSLIQQGVQTASNSGSTQQTNDSA